MFILESNTIPATAAQLTAAIADSLRKSIHLPADASPVVINGNLPNLESMTVDVSQGEIDPAQPLPDPTVPPEQQDAPTTESFTIIGDPISIAGIPLLFNLSAKKVAFAYARNPSGKLIATLRDTTAGHLSVEIGQSQLEAAMLHVAQQFAASSGVAIVKVQPTLTSISPTELDVQLQITAKKFVTAVIRVAGRIRINDQLIASASNLTADADGMVGNIAVNFLRPHLAKMNNQPLPLLAFSLGNVKFRGVEIHTDNGLKISAAFGSD